MPVNRQSYQECVLWSVEELKRRRMLKKLYLMHDWAAPHTAISSKYVLSDIFQDRLIVQHNLASLFSRPYTD